MAATYMLRKHQATVASAGKPEAIAERGIYAEALNRARADRAAKFPLITPENFEAAGEYQNERIAHWYAALTKATA